MATASKPSYPRHLSTGEGFLLGGVAACIAVSSAALVANRQLPDYPFRLLFQILLRWQKQGCNYKVNLSEGAEKRFTKMCLTSSLRLGEMKA